jgi:hypothetical protein
MQLNEIKQEKAHINPMKSNKRKHISTVQLNEIKPKGASESTHTHMTKAHITE